MAYNKLLKSEIKFLLNTKSIPNSGILAWEYNPFHNYRLTSNKYLYNNKFYTLIELEDNFNITIGGKMSISNQVKLNYYGRNRINEDGTSEKNWYNCTISGSNVTLGEELSDTNIPELYEAGLLVDFDTDELSFDLNHPVNILPLYSYDNSVNLILNDGTNLPRLINSRFSPTEKNQYKIEDRKGENDTNLYDQGEQFDIDTSLYKRTTKIPKLTFQGCYSGGNLKVGNYHFYFKYADADGNETDWIAESGLVSIFKGTTPSDITCGFENENSGKCVKFKLSNIDQAYSYIIVYYTKETAGINQESQTTAYKILQKFIIEQNNICNIMISGILLDETISIDEINARYELISSAYTQAQCKNILFLGNIHKPDIPYKELTDLSLRFLPYRHLKDFSDVITPEYEVYSNAKGYYDPNFIYNYTGYWNNELYRLGIVYILPDNSLSPVFNIRGGYKLTESSTYSRINLYNGENRNYINIAEDDYSIVVSGSNSKDVLLENAKGVITLDTYETTSSEAKWKIYSVDIKTSQEVLDELKKYVKGYFFVRQKRIPTTLCLAITIGTDKCNKTPVIPIGNKNTLFGQQLHGCNYTYVKPKVTFNLKTFTTTTTTQNLEYESDTINYISESFLGPSKELTNDFFVRVKPIKSTFVNVNAALCPESEIDNSYFGNIFNGGEFTVEYSDMLPPLNYFSWNTEEERHFFIEKNSYKHITKTLKNSSYDSKILCIPDSSKTMAIGKNEYSGIAGNAVDGWSFKYIGYENKVTDAVNITRGAWGPYLGFTGTNNPVSQYDIKIPGYNKSNINEYFKLRYNDNSVYYAISDRFNINDAVLSDKEALTSTINSDNSLGIVNTVYRGDCYICQFTHRMNRNFQDPSAPNNDIIVDLNCWSNNYSVSDGVIDKSKFASINIGDLNAIKLGSWVTFTVRCTKNLCLRGVDDSHIDEKSLVGHGRVFYPHNPLNPEGSYKIPEANCFNKGFLKDFGCLMNVELADVPYIKNEFSNRIIYSNPSVNDSFTNNFRVFTTDHFNDYTKEFGSITKLVEQNGSLVVVFEHGVGVIPVNEKALLSNAEGDDVYVGANQVIGEPKIISDKFGSQWAESVIKTPYYIYGVDTVAKKIWRVAATSENILTISDTRIQSFLNQNITLGEREVDPIIGIRNVKTHYNAFKNDVMFTFYDNLHGFEEKVWNICWNEITLTWTTFYSWVPSYSENIYNLYFSFDRNTSKWIAKLGICKKGSSFADGIVLDNNLIDDSTNSIIHETTDNCSHLKFKYLSLPSNIKIGTFDIVNRTLPNNYYIIYTIERDNFNNYKYFSMSNSGELLSDEDLSTYITTESGNGITSENTGDILYLSHYIPNDYPYPVMLLNIRATIYEKLTVNEALASTLVRNPYTNTLSEEGYYDCQIAVCLDSVYNNGFLIAKDDAKKSLTTDFWKHGQAGLQNIADKIKPCKWYGKQHPFEFEFCVSEYPELLKIFDNLLIVGNNAEPESFHFDIIGDLLQFSADKKNMYIRQEATKELYQYNGSDILYNNEWIDIEKEATNGYEISTQNIKSTILPQIYESRNDTFNEIEDCYKSISVDNKNYDELTGSEITHDTVTDEYHIWTHQKAIDINADGGRLRGNMAYNKDNWYILIRPIEFVQKNESTWDKVPVTIANIPVPHNVDNINEIDIPDDLKNRTIDTSSWGTLPLIQNVMSYDNAGHQIGIDNGNETDHNIPVKYTYTYGNPDDASTRQETKIRDKYIKIRVRYSGEKLAIINKIITIYSQSV